MFVDENHEGRCLNGISTNGEKFVISAAHIVVVRFTFGLIMRNGCIYLRKRSNKVVVLISYALIKIDKGLIQIINRRLFGLKMKIESTATKERLIVMPIFSWKPGIDTVKQLTLAARPLYERGSVSFVRIYAYPYENYLERNSNSTDGHDSPCN